MEPTLQDIVSITNALAIEDNDGRRDSCVLTSYALNDVLRRLGYASRPVRVEARVIPDQRELIATILGGMGDGTRRPAAGRGKWHGHLAVAVDDAWLLDATLDQANKSEWPQDAWVGPMVMELSEAFWNGRPIKVQVNASLVDYRLYPQQNGFAHAPDARSSHWKPLSDAIMGALGK
jgi:hypothetical protein